METIVKVRVYYEPNPNTSLFGRYVLALETPNSKVYKVRLKFDFDSLWHIAQDVTSPAFDFLVFSMAIYNADRVVSRALYSTDGWNRRIRLTVPVLNLAELNTGKDHFISALNFLTGDDWDIEFIQAERYVLDRELALVDRNVYKKVSLFSGGLDSLIGFVDGCDELQKDEKILLVSHKELGKEWGDQVRILDDCKKHQIYSGRYEQVLINAGINSQGWIGDRAVCEGTFRARSILFFGAGLYCAHAIDANMPLIVPENGTISLNIPLDRGRRNACSTRTTHPVFLKRLQQALTDIGIQNQLINPYQLKSKADMVSDCCLKPTRKIALKTLYRDSCSCAKRSHKSSWIHKRDANNQPIRHCGFCLPCLYRRVSLASVGWENKESYGINVFNSSELDIAHLQGKKGRDFRALLYFLKNRCNQDTIEEELISNGVTDGKELEEYTEFVLHSYEQVKEWVRANGSARIKRMAGL